MLCHFVIYMRNLFTTFSICDSSKVIWQHDITWLGLDHVDGLEGSNYFKFFGNIVNSSNRDKFAYLIWMKTCGSFFRETDIFLEDDILSTVVIGIICCYVVYLFDSLVIAGVLLSCCQLVVSVLWVL